MDQLRAAIDAGLASSSLRAYGPGLRAWLSFCAARHLPTLLPGDTPQDQRAAEEAVCLFAIQLARSLSAPTIRVYLAAVRLHHIRMLGSHPWAAGLRLPLVISGIRRQQQRAPAKRTAVTLDLLLEWRAQLQLDRPHDATVWAAILTAFFGLLRVSEYTLPARSAFDAARHLTRGDVSFLRDRSGAVHAMELHVKFAKAAQLGSDTPVPFAVQGGPLCPVAAIAHLLRLRPGAPTEPLFALATGPLSTPAFNAAFAGLVSNSSARGSLTTAHSLRIGGAMALHTAGAPDTVLQGIGRWRSGAFREYLRHSRPTLLAWAAQMSHPLLSHSSFLGTLPSCPAPSQRPTRLSSGVGRIAGQAGRL